MAKRRRDTQTLDLLRDFTPAPIVERFDDEAVKAFSIAARLAKAITATFADADMDRRQLAQDMSEFLQDDVSKHMLDKYASSSAEHQISAVRLLALVAVTEDVRPLNTLLKEAGLIAVPAEYEALLRRERARELKEKIEREEQIADAAWRASRR
ncbi:phage regulatory CII family protein [Pelagibacterium halotolerans]|uniref:DNA transposition protein n=1 Tax=Pelagibacterium halotolerans (strain DSM 22347 / JCM 15775 / CGMCC 1.7692 / B2) TaxID=1082931 RepID=G4RDZ1_PELHB|nr:phage regulatory CII family protein [Pelagibacterium halotolerans]AEQ50785.1 hypothetical protein KKY_746 [Pelagibacterium halotolerans B2]QJR19298.1 hypothetical protein HKM20_13130 [Pelagibacterium halotolerans]SDZ95800.1 hypothetical protein SAMN05428936_101672 [Pelagibacterium halotolerans]